MNDFAIVMLANMIQNIYIDTDMVAQEYIRQSNAESFIAAYGWRRISKVLDLECILDKQVIMAAFSAEVTLEEFAAEMEEATTGENEVETVN